MTQNDQQTPEEKDRKEEAVEPTEGRSGQDQVLAELEGKLAEAEKQAASYKDLFLRKAAEFDNYKRRMENETGMIVRFANEDLLQGILPVVDDLERSLKSATDVKESPFYKGVDLILQKILKILQAQGVTPFETVGKVFDVHFHDALLQVPKKGVAPHTILEEVAKGYMYYDKVLRHAKVVVSAEDESEQEVGASGEENKRSNES